MAKVVLFGNGQVSEVAWFYLKNDSDHEVVAFTVDEAYITDAKKLNLPVVPFEKIEEVYSPEQYQMLVMISYSKVNKLRAEKYYEAKRKGYKLISYINSRATVWPGLEIGDNTFIMENNVIQPFVSIGSNVIMWSGNHVGHHSKILDHCFLASHIVVSGSVTVGEYTFIGVNATLRDNINIAEANVIGAGATILHDTEPRQVYLGHPAELKKITSDRLKRI